MTESHKAMSPFAANPFIFIFSIVAIAAIVLYYGYMAIDRLGLQTEQEMATVLDKQYYPAGEAPVINIAAGRPWVQSQDTPEIFLLRLKSDNAEMYAAVSRATFDAVKPGDTVRISVQHRRLSGALQVVNVIR